MDERMGQEDGSVQAVYSHVTPEIRRNLRAGLTAMSLVDSSGALVARARITDDPAGVAQLIGMLTAAAGRPGRLILLCGEGAVGGEYGYGRYYV
jgi:hypothetical protein